VNHKEISVNPLYPRHPRSIPTFFAANTNDSQSKSKRRKPYEQKILLSRKGRARNATSVGYVPLRFDLDSSISRSN
jgi:hypothetical protein